VLSLTKLIVLAIAGSFFLAVSVGYFKVIKVVKVVNDFNDLKASPENQATPTNLIHQPLARAKSQKVR
jgi:hypothetical protein